MYEFFRGKIVERADGAAVIEAGGVGYRLNCSGSTLRQLPARGECKLFAHLVVRDDRHELYGFALQSERFLFRQLLQVSGVGPAVALALLSAYEPAALASHIATGEIVYLTKVKGIGKRTAERILVELRDRVQKGEGKAPGRPGVTGVLADAVLALCSLGLPRAEAERRVEHVKGSDLALEEVVMQALRATQSSSG